MSLRSRYRSRSTGRPLADYPRGAARRAKSPPLAPTGRAERQQALFPSSPCKRKVLLKPSQKALVEASRSQAGSKVPVVASRTGAGSIFSHSAFYPLT